MIDFRELAYFVCILGDSVSEVRDAVQLPELAARMHRALISPISAICPRSGPGAELRCFAIPLGRRLHRNRA